MTYSTIPSFERRRDYTLARMWRELNIHKWPKELGPPQSPGLDDTIWLMNQIAELIGKRRILKLSSPSSGGKAS